ncbi:MAG: sigma-54-dependent Fis family transcriptional regulator [Gammaproteobacteria bacterium]|nr:sigma-54-dependent Fis family transcriptional regulator [Gammaproteobacteria bacterium]
MLRSLEIAAATDVTVMLQGESGTGKELLANLLHQQSDRRDAPFVAINCAALPESLAESELFGHRKGAFTGATSHNCGRISSAEGGTLFLDEIAEMPLTVQAKLLRFLESGEYQAVGDTARKIADIRIVAATHAELRDKMQSGQFRADLYYRLNVVPFIVPPLRERADDIQMLIKTFTARAANQYRLEPPAYNDACIRLLERYDWPGNIRELRNLCERMVILFPGKEISAENLPFEIRASSGKRPYALSLPDAGLKLDDLEQDLLQQALEKTLGNQSKAAGMLGLTRHTFLYRLKKHSIV